MAHNFMVPELGDKGSLRLRHQPLRLGALRGASHAHGHMSHGMWFVRVTSVTVGAAHKGNLHLPAPSGCARGSRMLPVKLHEECAAKGGPRNWQARGSHHRWVVAS